MPVQDKQGNRHWKLAGDDGNVPNESVLESEYANLCSYFGSKSR